MLSKKSLEVNLLLGRSISHIAAEKGLSIEEQDTIVSLFANFLSWYTTGTIGSHIDEINNNSDYRKMIDALQDTNYGPWMESVLADNPPDATELFLPKRTTPFF